MNNLKTFVQRTRILLILVLVFVSIAESQVKNPMDYKRWNKLDINKVATVFDNVGMLCNGNNQNYNLRQPHC